MEVTCRHRREKKMHLQFVHVPAEHWVTDVSHEAICRSSERFPFQLKGVMLLTVCVCEACGQEI